MGMNLTRLLEEDKFTRKEIIYLLNISNPEERSELFQKARIIRSLNGGTGTKQFGLIEISNHCRQNCRDCNTCLDNKNPVRFRMSQEEILETAHEISNKGIRNIILQCGEDAFFSSDLIAYIIYKIKVGTNAKLILNMGNRKEHELKEWKIAGADVYLVKNWLEELRILSQSQKQVKIKNLISKVNGLQEIGYQVGLKNLFHVPLVSIENIADNILLYHKLNINQISLNACNGKKARSFYSKDHKEIFLIYKIIAVMRLILKNLEIQTFSLNSSSSLNDKQTSLDSGADLIVHDFTPRIYRAENYKSRNERRFSELEPVTGYEINNELEILEEKISIGG